MFSIPLENPEVKEILYQITLNRRVGSLCPPLPSAMKTMQFSLIWY